MARAAAGTRVLNPKTGATSTGGGFTEVAKSIAGPPPAGLEVGMSEAAQRRSERLDRWIVDPEIRWDVQRQWDEIEAEIAGRGLDQEQRDRVLDVLTDAGVEPESVSNFLGAGVPVDEIVAWESDDQDLIKYHQAGIPVSQVRDFRAFGYIEEADPIIALHKVGIRDHGVYDDYRRIVNDPGRHPGNGERRQEWEGVIALHLAFGTSSEHHRWNEPGYLNRDGSVTDLFDRNRTEISALNGDVDHDIAVRRAHKTPEQALEWEAALRHAGVDTDVSETYNDLGRWTSSGISARHAGDWMRTSQKPEDGFDPDVARKLAEAGYQAPVVWGEEERMPGTELPSACTPKAMRRLHEEQPDASGFELVSAAGGQDQLF